MYTTQIVELKLLTKTLIILNIIKIAVYSSVFYSTPYDLHISTRLVVCQLKKVMQCAKRKMFSIDV